MVLNDISGRIPAGLQQPSRLDDGGFVVPLGTAKGVSFQDMLKAALGDVSRMQDEAQNAIARFVRGEQVELHQVMAATEEAGIALDLLIEIRNKLIEAYRAVINMQS